MAIRSLCGLALLGYLSLGHQSIQLNKVKAVLAKCIITIFSKISPYWKKLHSNRKGIHCRLISVRYKNVETNTYRIIHTSPLPQYTKKKKKRLEGNMPKHLQWLSLSSVDFDYFICLCILFCAFQNLQNGPLTFRVSAGNRCQDPREVQSIQQRMLFAEVQS